MARQCRNRENRNYNSTFGQCSKCNKYGHKIEDWRMNVKCYACGKFGQMTNQCRSSNYISYNKVIQKNNVACYACNKIGHIAKFYRRKNPLVKNDGSNDKGK